MEETRPLFFAASTPAQMRELRTILGENFPICVKETNAVADKTQGTVVEVALRRCDQVSKCVAGTVLVEETSLEIHAWRGMTSVHAKDRLEELGPEGLYRELDGKNTGATAQCVFVLSRGIAPPAVFSARVEGQIVAPRGKRNSGWERVFQPDGFDRTYAEMTDMARNRVSERAWAATRLRDYILANMNDFRVAKTR